MNSRPKLQYGLRLLLAVSATIAIFFCGYKLGYEQGLDARYANLIKLIKSAIQPGSWEDTGSSPVYYSDDPLNPFAESKSNHEVDDDKVSADNPFE